jgi:hypothetical protein
MAKEGWAILVGVMLVLALGIGAMTLLRVWGGRRWQMQTDALRAGLQASRRVITPARYQPSELQGLPAPVQRFFRTALTDGQPMVAGVSLVQHGTINLREGDGPPNWRLFTATQQVSTQRPGFDWDARVAQWPAVHVHDAYVAGSGTLHAALLGAITVARVRDTPDIARGELMRYLAEAAWYPTALLPSQGVVWSAVDEKSAHASLGDGATQVSLLFTFGSDGLIDNVRAEGRARIVGGKTTLMPWRGRFNHHVRRDGMQVPLEGEVAWLALEGQQPYWRGRVTALDYEWSP